MRGHVPGEADRRRVGAVRRVLRQSGLYALGNAGLKASGLLLALLYLNPAYLAVEEFGYYGLLTVTGQLGVFVASLGLGSGLLKYMTDPAYETERPALPFTALVATVGSAAVSLLLLWVLAGPLAGVLLDSTERAVLVRLLAVYVALKVIGAIPLMVLRVHERAGWFALGTISEMVFLLAGAYYLLVGRGLGLYGLMIAHVVASAASVVLMVGVMLARVPWRFDRRLLHPLLRFGVPLVMASLAGWFLNAGDRYLLKWLEDARTVGLYEWAARLSGVLNLLLVQSFNQAFAVIGLKALGRDPSGAGMHRTTFRHFTVWGGWAVLGLALLSFDLTRLLPAAALYLEAEDLVLLLALGFLANGVYFVVINVVYGAGRSRAISLNVVGAAVLNVGLNLLLIPFVGVLGAALATFVSYLALALGATYVARQETPEAFPWGVFAGVALLVVGLFLLGRPSTAWATAPRLLVRIGLVMVYPLLVIVTGLYSRSDLRLVRSGLLGVFGAGPEDETAPGDSPSAS